MKIVITAGGTREYIDPVRYIGNESSGKQGIAIADACQDMGWDTHLIMANGKNADELLRAVQDQMPCDVFISVAAVCDFKPQFQGQKIKKSSDEITITFTQTVDILKTISVADDRPKLVIGFAAETNDVLQNAKDKLKRKQCDWILANDVSQGVFGSDDNHIYFMTPVETDDWGLQSKQNHAKKLTKKIQEYFNDSDRSF